MRDDPGFLPQGASHSGWHFEKTQVARLAAGSVLTRPAPRTPSQLLLHKQGSTVQGARIDYSRAIEGKRTDKRWARLPLPSWVTLWSIFLSGRARAQYRSIHKVLTSAGPVGSRQTADHQLISAGSRQRPNAPQCRLSGIGRELFRYHPRRQSARPDPVGILSSLPLSTDTKRSDACYRDCVCGLLI